MSKDNMNIWEQLCETDPKYTKGFDTGRFQGSSINPQYKWRRLTEMFGPAGIGWGVETYNTNIVEVLDEKMICVAVTAFYMDGGKKYLTPPGFGQDYILRKTSHGFRSDEDAAKKAFTDAFGNAWKYIGLSADVYLRSHEDDKYVAHLKEKYGEQERKTTDATQKQEIAAPVLPEILVEHQHLLKIQDDKLVPLPQETEEGNNDLANISSWYLTQIPELPNMITCMKQMYPHVNMLRTDNKLSPIEEGTCDWTVEKLKNIRTLAGLDKGWKRIATEVNVLKDEFPEAYTGITKAFRNAKEDISNGNRAKS